MSTVHVVHGRRRTAGDRGELLIIGVYSTRRRAEAAAMTVKVDGTSNGDVDRVDIHAWEVDADGAGEDSVGAAEPFTVERRDNGRRSEVLLKRIVSLSSWLSLVCIGVAGMWASCLIPDIGGPTVPWDLSGPAFMAGVAVGLLAVGSFVMLTRSGE